MHVPAAENAENEMREGGWVGGGDKFSKLEQYERRKDALSVIMGDQISSGD